MKNSFSQMAFNFGAETPAPPVVEENGYAVGQENGYSGVRVRIKSLKNVKKEAAPEETPTLLNGGSPAESTPAAQQVVIHEKAAVSEATPVSEKQVRFPQVIELKLFDIPPIEVEASADEPDGLTPEVEALPVEDDATAIGELPAAEAPTTAVELPTAEAATRTAVEMPATEASTRAAAELAAAEADRPAATAGIIAAIEDQTTAEENTTVELNTTVEMNTAVEVNTAVKESSLTMVGPYSEAIGPEKPVPVESSGTLTVDKFAPAPEAVEAAAEVRIPADKEEPVRAAPASPPPKSKRGRKSLKQVAAEADLIEIPGDEVLFSKQYYTMRAVAEMFRVNQSLLRFWETEFDILQPRKNKKGDRYFRPVDIKHLHLIYHLLRQRKYTIEGAKEFLKKNKKAEERFEAIQRLQQLKAFLLEWKAQL